LSTAIVDATKKQIEEPRFVNRDDFENSFLDSDNLEPLDEKHQ
jgi:hypothetical protein